MGKMTIKIIAHYYCTFARFNMHVSVPVILLCSEELTLHKDRLGLHSQKGLWATGISFLMGVTLIAWSLWPTVLTMCFMIDALAHMVSVLPP